MIFNLWTRVVVKIGEDEKHVFDRSRLMFTEVQEIEKVTGMSYQEWEGQLGKFSITAVGALIHVLRRRDDMPSDFLTMQFNVSDLDIVPLKDDGSEYTPEEATAELVGRMREGADKAEAGPTLAAAAVAPESGSPPGTTGTSPLLPESSGSAAGSSNGSRGKTSSSTRRTSTQSGHRPPS